MFDLSNLFYCKLQVMLQVTSLFVRQTNMKKGANWGWRERVLKQWRYNGDSQIARAEKKPEGIMLNSKQ